MLYVIAGCSLSGKTSSRQYLTRQYGVSGIDSDTLRTIANHIAPDIDVGHTQLVMKNYQNMVPVIEAFFAARSFFDEPYIIEGDGINIATMLPHVESGAAKVVVLGYPNSTVDSMLERIKTTFSESHWIFELNKTDAAQRIAELIEFSRFLQAEAERCNLPFIDVSAMDLETVIRHVNDVLFVGSAQA